MFPCLALTHGDLENVGKMISSEMAPLQEEEGAMDCPTSDVLSIVLRGRKERERERGLTCMYM